MEVPGLRSRSGEVYTLLSELYNNALEHGVLACPQSGKRHLAVSAAITRSERADWGNTDGHFIRFSLEHQPGRVEVPLPLSVKTVVMVLISLNIRSDVPAYVPSEHRSMYSYVRLSIIDVQLRTSEHRSMSLDVRLSIIDVQLRTSEHRSMSLDVCLDSTSLADVSRAARIAI